MVSFSKLFLIGWMRDLPNSGYPNRYCFADRITNTDDKRISGMKIGIAILVVLVCCTLQGCKKENHRIKRQAMLNLSYLLCQARTVDT